MLCRFSRLAYNGVKVKSVRSNSQYSRHFLILKTFVKLQKSK